VLLLDIISSWFGAEAEASAIISSYSFFWLNSSGHIVTVINSLIALWIKRIEEQTIKQKRAMTSKKRMLGCKKKDFARRSSNLSSFRQLKLY
jgi:hypothetical protein